MCALCFSISLMCSAYVALKKDFYRTPLTVDSGIGDYYAKRTVNKFKSEFEENFHLSNTVNFFPIDIFFHAMREKKT